MKILGVVLFLAIVALCKADYSDNQKQKLDEATSKCVGDLDSSADADIGKKFKYGELREMTDTNKKFILCTMQKLNFMNVEATVLEENIVKFLADNYDQKMSLDVIKKCSQLKSETTEDKGYTTYQWNQLQLKSSMCQKQLQLPKESDIPARAHRGDVTYETDLFKKFVLCESRSMGFVDEKGVPIKQVLVDFMTEGYNNNLVQQLVDRCAQGELGDEPHERAFNYYKCFWTQKKFDV